MADVEDAVDEAMEAVGEIGDDTGKFTQEESREFYEGVARACEMRANVIKEELGVDG